MFLCLWLLITFSLSRRVTALNQLYTTYTAAAPELGQVPLVCGPQCICDITDALVGITVGNACAVDSNSSACVVDFTSNINSTCAGGGNAACQLEWPDIVSNFVSNTTCNITLPIPSLTLTVNGRCCKCPPVIRRYENPNMLLNNGCEDANKRCLDMDVCVLPSLWGLSSDCDGVTCAISDPNTVKIQDFTGWRNRFNGDSNDPAARGWGCEWHVASPIVEERVMHVPPTRELTAAFEGEYFFASLFGLDNKEETVLYNTVELVGELSFDLIDSGMAYVSGAYRMISALDTSTSVRLSFRDKNDVIIDETTCGDPLVVFNHLEIPLALDWRYQDCVFVIPKLTRFISFQLISISVETKENVGQWSLIDDTSMRVFTPACIGLPALQPFTTYDIDCSSGYTSPSGTCTLLCTGEYESDVQIVTTCNPEWDIRSIANNTWLDSPYSCRRSRSRSRSKRSRSRSKSRRSRSRSKSRRSRSRSKSQRSRSRSKSQRSRSRSKSQRSRSRSISKKSRSRSRSSSKSRTIRSKSQSKSLRSKSRSVSKKSKSRSMSKRSKSRSVSKKSRSSSKSESRSGSRRSKSRSVSKKSRSQSQSKTRSVSKQSLSRSKSQPSGSRSASKKSRSKSKTHSKTRSRSHSRSPSQSHSRSRSKTRSKSISLSETRSKSRSRSRSYSSSASVSHSRSHSQSRSKSYSKSQSRSQSFSKSRSSSKSRSHSLSLSHSSSRSKSRSRSRSRSLSVSRSRSPSQSLSQSHSKSRSRSNTRSRSLSKSGSLTKSNSKSHSKSTSGSHSSSRSMSWTTSRSKSRSKSYSKSRSRSRSKSHSTSLSKSASVSNSRSPSLSRTLSASVSKSRSLSMSHNRSTSDSKSLPRSRSSSRTSNLTKSNTRSKSLSKSTSRTSDPSNSLSRKTKSKSGIRSESRSLSRSRSHSNTSSKSTSKTNDPSNSNSRSRTRSRTVYTRSPSHSPLKSSSKSKSASKYSASHNTRSRSQSPTVSSSMTASSPSINRTHVSLATEWNTTTLTLTFTCPALYAYRKIYYMFVNVASPSDVCINGFPMSGIGQCGVNMTDIAISMCINQESCTFYYADFVTAGFYNFSCPYFTNSSTMQISFLGECTYVGSRSSSRSMSLSMSLSQSRIQPAPPPPESLIWGLSAMFFVSIVLFCMVCIFAGVFRRRARRRVVYKYTVDVAKSQ